MEKPRGYHGEWSALRGPMAKTRGAAGPEGFGRGTSRGTPFTMIPPRLFHIISFFQLPGLVKRDIFHWRQTQHVPRESIGHYTGLGQGILVELNPNILVRDEEIMLDGPLSQHRTSIPSLQLQLLH